MASMTISVPDDLKAEMGEVEDPPSWSAVACRAFRQELGEIASRKEVKDMEDTLARIRADLAEQASESAKCGYEWAMQNAGAEELKRLAAACRTGSYPEDTDGFYAVVHPEDEDQYEAKEFFECNEDYIEVGTFDAKEFIAGAIDAWDEIQRHL